MGNERNDVQDRYQDEKDDKIRQMSEITLRNRAIGQAHRVAQIHWDRSWRLSVQNNDGFVVFQFMTTATIFVQGGDRRR